MGVGPKTLEPPPSEWPPRPPLVSPKAKRTSVGSKRARARKIGIYYFPRRRRRRRFRFGVGSTGSSGGSSSADSSARLGEGVGVDETREIAVDFAVQSR